jgi:hypothetical protein
MPKKIRNLFKWIMTQLYLSSAVNKRCLEARPVLVVICEAHKMDFINTISSLSRKKPRTLMCWLLVYIFIQVTFAFPTGWRLKVFSSYFCNFFKLSCRHRWSLPGYCFGFHLTSYDTWTTGIVKRWICVTACTACMGQGYRFP